MKLLLTLALVASAAAFAPAATQRTSTALNAEFSKDYGAMAPLGLFDPCAMLEDASQERFNDLRAKEITHGRISMLAVVGYLTTYAGVRLPGCEDTPYGLAALDKVDNGYAIWTLITMMSLGVIMQDQSGEAIPGDFRNGAIDFGWDKKSNEWQQKKRLIELNNGRGM